MFNGNYISDGTIFQNNNIYEYANLLEKYGCHNVHYIVVLQVHN